MSEPTTPSRPQEGVALQPTEEDMKALLVGRRIVSVELTEPTGATWRDHLGMPPEGHLTLDDGTKLTLAGNEGGCSCGGGDYSLTHLSAVENAITNVELEDPEGDDHYTGGTYRIFVFAADDRIELAAFDGDDGSGYYGTGWWLRVEPADG